MNNKLTDVAFYYINLDRSIDRKKAAEQQAAMHGINLQRVAAVDGRALKEEDLTAYDRAKRKLEYRTDLSPGEHACILSHLKTLRLFLETDKQYAVILEDDFVLHPKFTDGINWLVHKTSGWEALKLYTEDGKIYHLNKKSDSDDAWELIFPKKIPWVSVGNIYTRQAALTVLQSFKQYWMGFDTQLAWFLLTQKVAFAGIFPSLVSTSDPDNQDSTIDDGGNRYEAAPILSSTPENASADSTTANTKNQLTMRQYVKHRLNVWRMAYSKWMMRQILKIKLHVTN